MGSRFLVTHAKVVVARVSLPWPGIAARAMREDLDTPDDAALPGIGSIAGQQHLWFDSGLPIRVSRYSRTP
jgi:hypothetical protein